MYSNVKPFLLHTISSLHVGSGSKIGLVDLPIQREKHTGYPKIESSSLKGAIRSTIRNHGGEAAEGLEDVFGSALESEQEPTGQTVASAVAFADARVLLFPVRSMRGVFAYITCPHVIERWNQEVEAYLGTKADEYKLEVPSVHKASSAALLLENQEKQRSVVLEEYSWVVEVEENTTRLATTIQNWFGNQMPKDHFVNRVVVLSNEEFVDFVTLSTEVNARIRISDQSGTVEKGALWYEENVPPETVFYSFLFSGKVRKEQAKFSNATAVENHVVQNLPPVYQVGGNSTLGRGMIRHLWLEGVKS